MKIYTLILIVSLLVGTPVLGAEFDLPEGGPITLNRISELIEIVYEFLIAISIWVMLGSLLVGGIMWVTAGDSDRVEKAKSIIKGGVIGSIIILGSGVIIRTVDSFVQSLGDDGIPSGSYRCNSDSGCPRGYACINSRCVER